MATPTAGSGSKNQIAHRGQTSSPKFGANPNAKTKGSSEPTDYGIQTKAE